jgi:uncharacterized membrane protein
VDAGPLMVGSRVAILTALHVLAAVVWVGGMFFAYMVLRPSASALASDARLNLWHRVFHRFFPFVWASIAVLLASGYGMMFLAFGGFAGAPLYVHAMQGVGILMMLLFLHLFFGPWRRFAAAVRAAHYPEAGNRLGEIRRVVATNLALGLLTIIVGASGRFW